jgi:hypothetical protein
MSLQTTTRHHTGGGMIADAITKGRYGADVVAVDLGKKTKNNNTGTTTTTKYVPRWLLPRIMTLRHRAKLRKLSRPDIILAAAKEDGQPSRRRTYTVTLVEIKYCRDSDPTWQQKQATKQHAALGKLLTKAGHKVKHTTILLGVGGTIYKETKKQILELGVGKAETNKLLSRLHTYAIKSIKRIMIARRIKEHEVNRRRAPIYLKPTAPTRNRKVNRGTENRINRHRTPPGVT